MISLRPYQQGIVRGIIYRAKCSNTGKVYIGQTIQPLSERMGDHRRKAIVYKSKGHLHSAIRKYGFDAFTWEIIDTAESREELNEKEKHWISVHDSTNPSSGYNLTYGGDAFQFSPEARKKIGASGRGKKRSNAFKEHLRKISKGRGNPFYGRHHTEEAKRKNREAHIGKKLTPDHISKCIHLGSSNGRAVIDEKIAKEIKDLIAQGWRQCDLVKKFGVSKSLISGIRRGTTWRHI